MALSIYDLAKGICQTLFDAGYTAYFAGGWVRDLLMGKKSDEIDIATNAPPPIVQSLFKKTVPVGISFGVVIVVLEGVHFEVATFRKDHPYFDGRHPDGVDFSTPQKDAERRDFTINGMFFDPLTEELFDYVKGQPDLKAGIIRAIGHPKRRFEEDRLRMVRAVRFAARFGFAIEESTREAIQRFAPSLFPAVSMERIWQELCKMAAFPHFDTALSLLHEMHLFPVIFPQLGPITSDELQMLTISFPYFPLHTPPIVYLMELFTHLSTSEKLDICTYLKTSTEEKKLVEFFTYAQNVFNRSDTDNYTWAYFYAHPLSPLFLEITGAKLLPPLRLPFFEEHQTRRDHLIHHIERILQKKPLLASHHLQEIGIPPGKKMGELLKQGERFAINENLQTPDSVLNRLDLHPSN